MSLDYQQQQKAIAEMRRELGHHWTKLYAPKVGVDFTYLNLVDGMSDDEVVQNYTLLDTLKHKDGSNRICMTLPKKKS